MSLKNKSTQILIFLSLILIILYVNFIVTDPIRICEKIQVHDTLEDVVTKLGKPYSKEQKNDFVVYYFESNAVAAGPIRIAIKSERVFKTQCSEDQIDKL